MTEQCVYPIRAEGWKYYSTSTAGTDYFKKALERKSRAV